MGEEAPATKKPKLSVSVQLLDLEQQLCTDLHQLQYPHPVTHIYNPLDYASETHCCFVNRYGDSTKTILFLGMNPGPFGMAQNGVPFGDSHMVKEWLRVTGEVKQPPREHPKRKVQGLACSRREVSGTRFWELMKELCGTPEEFFRDCYVHNYCPFCFMEESGKNITPADFKNSPKKTADRSKDGIKKLLQEKCDEHLRKVVKLLQIKYVIGVGKYAEERAKVALKELDGGWEVFVCSIMHPSPINPAANRPPGWSEHAKEQLRKLELLDVITGRSSQSELIKTSE